MRHITCDVTLGRRRFGCSHKFVRGLLIALTVAVSTACELFRLVDLDPDVVVLSLLLESGQTEARMLAIHPHREWRGAAPEITASLEGPGWTAAFVGTGVRKICEDSPRAVGPFTCLRASLPEPIAPGTYRLRGRVRTPRVSFTGETTVPGMPLLMESSDTLRLPVPDTSALIPIPLHYQVDSATSALLLDGEVAVGDETFAITRFFWELADTLETFYVGNPETWDLRFRGIGPNYSNWFRHTDGELVLPPWPSYGIEGEGVYGYFDGISAPTRWLHIVVGEP